MVRFFSFLMFILSVTGHAQTVTLAPGALATIQANQTTTVICTATPSPTLPKCTVESENDCTDGSSPYVVQVGGQDFDNLCHSLSDAMQIIQTLKNNGQCS
jgi:hypothetical protein